MSQTPIQRSRAENLRDREERGDSRAGQETGRIDERILVANGAVSDAIAGPRGQCTRLWRVSSSHHHPPSIRHITDSPAVCPEPQTRCRYCRNQGGFATHCHRAHGYEYSYSAATANQVISYQGAVGRRTSKYEEPEAQERKCSCCRHVAVLPGLPAAVLAGTGRHA